MVDAKNRKKSSDITKSSHPIHQLLKNQLFLAFLVFCFSSVLLLYIFRHPIKRIIWEKTQAYKQYRLVPHYTAEDVEKRFALISQESWFRVYRWGIAKDARQVVFNAISADLMQYRDEESLLNRMKQLQLEIENYAYLFYYLDYPADYYQKKLQKNYPEAFRYVLYRLMEKHMELEVLALFYKSTYDRKFMLKFDKITKAANGKFKEIIYQMYPGKTQRK